MNVVTLNPSTFLGEEVVTDYSTMIWTERYTDAGEFELRSPAITQTMNLLPEDSLVGIAESREVMIVETHEVVTDSDGIAEVVVKGRTFEGPTLENRIIVEGSPYKEPFQMSSIPGNPAYGVGIGKTMTEVVGALVWNAICNPNNWSAIKNGYGNDPKNQIPNVNVVLTEHVDENNLHWWLENGPLYPTIQDFLIRGGTGIRNIRPPFKAEGVTTTMGVDSLGTILRYPGATGNIGTLKIDLYHGNDRSKNQTDRPQVIFSHRAGDLSEQKYLRSIKDLKNMVFVASSIGNVSVFADEAVDPYVTGRNRRILYLDGGDVGDQDPTAFVAALVQKGEIELRKHNRQLAFDASISANTPSRYGFDYFLGDKVTLMGNYGFETTMQVREFTRTEDAEGDRGFPMLVLPDA